MPVSNARMSGVLHDLLAGVNDLSGDGGVIFRLIEAEHGDPYSGGEHCILGWKPGEGQCFGVGKAPWAFAQVEHPHIAGELFLYQKLHDIDELGAVRQDGEGRLIFFGRLFGSGFGGGRQFRRY